jgi:hypothetical protein
MDKTQAQTIVKTTFESPFDKSKFVSFIKNLLNHIDEAPFSYRGNSLPDSYDQYISSMDRIGKYTDGQYKIDILIVRLKKETSIERARTRQRNFIAWYLNGSRGGEMKDAALVAFVSPNEHDWRFSLVKMDYRFEEGKNGRMKVKEEFTPARRWSFLVGNNENSHTAQNQFVPIIMDDEDDPTLARLEEAFNIEKVTKEFFEKYHDLFIRTEETLGEIVSKDKKIKDDFSAKGVNTVDFAKKLLGQIVFLYFLQKKGWFGVERDDDWGTGPKNFLRELFDGKHCKYMNFFNDILEPLFYQALRNDRRHDDDYYSKLNCKIPFLNGGLFDPINNYDWVHTDILLPNELFSNSKKTKEGDTGNGIFDIFDRYNFTVKEDEPLEREVAVDPEMLGKVFENLLEVKDRKSKGTYYTPREIVHYMCQQSLINYLHTELNPETTTYEKLGEKQFDMLGNKAKDGQLDITIEHRSNSEIPKEDIEYFIQHGENVLENEAIVGMTKSYSYKLKESIRQNAKLIDEKLSNIRMCDPAIGSGAFPVGMMTEIVKARNVLSIYIKDCNRNVYNFKRECIEKSLYGVDIDPGAVEIAKLRLWLSLVVDEEDIKQIKPLPNLDYKIICGNSLLSVSKNLFNNEQFRELERLKPIHLNETDPKKKQEYKDRIDRLISKITNGHKEFDFEVYFSEVFHEKKGFDVVIGNPPYGFRNVLSADEKKLFRKVMKIDFSTGDVAELFIKILLSGCVKSRGFLTFIIPKKSLYGESWSDVRRIWLDNEIKFLMDASQAFENVLLEQVAFGFQKKAPTANHKISIGALDSNTNSIHVFGIFNINEILRSDLRNIQIYRGLYPHQLLSKIDKVSFPDTSLLLKSEIGISNITKYLTFEAENNYPCTKGIDIIRYGLKSNIRYLNGKVARQYLKQYTDDKIVAQEIIAHIQNPIPHIQIMIFYDDEGRLFNDTCVEIKAINKNLHIKFLLAYLQSAFCSWYAYNFVYNRAVRTMHFINYYVTQIPIPKQVLDMPKLQQPFITFVDRIIAITKDEDYLQNSSKQAQVKALEREIDQLVYKLYGLTDEEVKIVEGANS